MTCRKFTEVLIEYVSGELTVEETAALRGHLDVCPPCVCLLQTYQLTIRLTRCLPPAEVPPAAAERLRAALRSAGAAPDERV